MHECVAYQDWYTRSTELGRALDGNDSWWYFSIANTDTSNAGLSKLAFVLEDREWHTVDVGFTNITDRGLKALSMALYDEQSSSWRHLRLSHCSLFDEGAIRLAMALRENPRRWRMFDVGNTNMTYDDMKEVSEAWRKMWIGILWICGTMINVSLEHMLSKVLQMLIQHGNRWNTNLLRRFKVFGNSHCC